MCTSSCTSKRREREQEEKNEGSERDRGALRTGGRNRRRQSRLHRSEATGVPLEWWCVAASTKGERWWGVWCGCAVVLARGGGSSGREGSVGLSTSRPADVLLLCFEPPCFGTHVFASRTAHHSSPAFALACAPPLEDPPFLSLVHRLCRNSIILPALHVRFLFLLCFPSHHPFFPSRPFFCCFSISVCALLAFFSFFLALYSHPLRPLPLPRFFLCCSVRAPLSSPLPPPVVLALGSTFVVCAGCNAAGRWWGKGDGNSGGPCDEGRRRRRGRWGKEGEDSHLTSSRSHSPLSSYSQPHQPQHLSSPHPCSFVVFARVASSVTQETVVRCRQIPSRLSAEPSSC